MAIERRLCLNENKQYPTTTFFKADPSSIYGALGYIPFCKKCIGGIANEFYKAYSDKKFAILLTCMKLDVRFFIDTYENVFLDELSADKLMLAYLDSLQNDELVSGNFDDSGYSLGLYETLRSYLDTGNLGSSDIEASWVNYIVTQDDLDFWGGRYNQEEYYILSNTLDDYLESFPHATSSASSIDLLKNICYTTLDIKNARDMEQPDSKLITELTKRLSDLLGHANMKPNQKKVADNSTVTFGTLIKKIENEDPLPDPMPDWTDNDIFKDVGEWIVGHLSRMLGKDVEGLDTYEKDLEEFTVAPTGDLL